MKSICCLLLAVVVLVGGTDGSFAQLAPAEGGGGLRLKDSKAEIPIVFEDAALPPSAKESIVQDMHLLLGHLKMDGYRTCKVSRTVKARGKNLEVTRALVLGGGRKQLPRGFEGDYGLLGRAKDGSEFVVVPKRLSRAYREALAMREKNPDAFAKLGAFVRFMNDLESAKIPPIEDLLYLHGNARQFRAELAGKPPERFAKEFGTNRYQGTSILKVTKGKDGLENTLLAELSVLDKKTGRIIGEMPIVYHDGRWKILIALSRI